MKNNKERAIVICPYHKITYIFVKIHYEKTKLLTELEKSNFVVSLLDTLKV